MPVTFQLHHQPSRTAAAEPVVPRACPEASSGPAAGPQEEPVTTVRLTRRQQRRERASGVGASLRRVVGRMALGVIVLAGVSVAVSPDGVLPDAVTAMVGSCAEASAAGTVNVAIAVDPGVIPGAPRGPEVMCVTVGDGATGADVLVERARLLGRPPPRWAPSGLMCAIDGYPATGCGERVDGSYRYWSYHLGDEGSWSYARTGPAMRRATPARMEGWHFIAGANSPADPPPRVAASAAAVCPPSAPSPIVNAPAAPAPAPAPAPTGATPNPGSPPVGGSGPGVGGSGQSGATGAPSGSGGGAGGTGAAGSDDAQLERSRTNKARIDTALLDGTGTDGQSPSAGGTMDGDDTTADGGASSGASGGGGAGGAGDSDEAMAAGRGPAMALVRSASGDESAGVPLAVVLMVAAVAAVGIGATMRSRRRSHS